MSETTRAALAAFLILGWVLWCISLYLRQRAQRPSIDVDASTLIAYASQSGSAAELAKQKAEQLGGNKKVNLLPLNRVCHKTLLSTTHAHFVVSTYGQGEPPDNGLRFSQDILAGPQALDLSHLHYSVTALGDSSYSAFCAFGHAVHQGLAKLGANPQQAVVELDSQQTKYAASQSQAPQELCWELIKREQLNLNSPNAGLYLLSFKAQSVSPVWRPGDIVSMLPKHSEQHVRAWLQAQQLDGQQSLVVDGVSASLIQHLAQYVLPRSGPDKHANLTRWLQQLTPLPRREYSVASAHQEGELTLIVRAQNNASGEPGLGSTWLTQYCALGDITYGMLRANINCHTNDDSRPLLLIGAGSGLAGLRAQLAQRALSANPGPVVMVFGERDPHYDKVLSEALTQWQQQGIINELYLAFSQDPEKPTYVQDCLFQHSQSLAAFIHSGADIYVCGNKQGMGNSVHQALQALLGNEHVNELLDSGRYRRDLY